MAAVLQGQVRQLLSPQQPVLHSRGPLVQQHDVPLSRLLVNFERWRAFLQTWLQLVKMYYINNAEGAAAAAAGQLRQQAYIEEGTTIVACCWFTLVRMRAVLWTWVGVYKGSPAQVTLLVSENGGWQIRGMKQHHGSSFQASLAYTRVAPYFGTPKLANATFNLHQQPRWVSFFRSVFRYQLEFGAKDMLTCPWDLMDAQSAQTCLKYNDFD